MTVTINLGPRAPACEDFTRRTHEQLSTGQYAYPCSILALPGDFGRYLAEHRTARKRAGRAGRLGYRFQVVNRSEVQEDVYVINTSTPERQGRPMSSGYQVRHEYHDPPWPCPRHRVYPYGVLDRGGRLVAYLWMYRVGELAMVSSILGHADHLRNDVMYLLAVEALRHQAEEVGPGWAFYNRHDGGTEGLRFYKERVGFMPERVEWTLS